MLLIKNGTLHLPGGEVLTGSDVLVQDGHIKEIGKDLVSADARILDAGGKDVFPGFILPVSSVGLTDYANLRQGDANDVSAPNQAGLHVRYALDGREVALQRYWLSGITSIGAAPGNGALLAGQMGLYHITGRYAAQMCVKDTIAVKGNFSSEVKRTFGGKGMAPMTRMGMAAQLREALREAKQWMESEEKSFQVNYAALARVLAGEIPLLMNVNTVGDISTVLDIAAEFGVKVVLNLAYQAHMTLDAIVESKAAVLLGDLFDMGARIQYGTDVDAISGLEAHGIPVGISGAPNGVGRENLLWNGCRLVQMGYTPAQALDMLTVNTAKALGVDDCVGQIKEGLWADLVIYDGDPFQRWDADVFATVVAGELIYTKESGVLC